jgi:uncharacterized protein HemY
VTGPVALYLGVLAATVGEWDHADTYFTTAAAIQERIGAPTWLARTRVEWARILLARAEAQDAEEANDLLRQALTTARELGLPIIEREAVALLSEA